MFIFTIFLSKIMKYFIKKRVSKKFCFVRRVGQMGQVGREENFELGTNCKLVPAGGKRHTMLLKRRKAEFALLYIL